MEEHSRALPPNTENLLIETLKTQEFLKQEFFRLSTLIEAQAEELRTLRRSNESLNLIMARLEGGFSHAGFSLPYGLRAANETSGDTVHISGIEADISGAFYPPSTSQLLTSAFVRYRQLLGLDLEHKSIGVLTTSSCEYSDVLEATGARSSLEIRLHSINGPLTLMSRSPSGSTLTSEPGDIEAAVLKPANCDLLWIPDPDLASLVLRCRGAVERISERVHEGFLFCIRSDAWNEDEARMRVHRAGFAEVSRVVEAGYGSYVTRYHENRGFYVHSTPQQSDTPVTHFLLASKIPSASFRLIPLNSEQHDGQI